MFIHRRTKDGKFILRTAAFDDAGQMETLQQICFPSLAKEELLSKAHYVNHLKIFPEGQLVILDGERVIASSSNLRMHFPPADHTFMEATDNLWITNTHLPDGEWLYQLDLGVLPQYRGLKLSRELYNAQQELARESGMKGQITAGMTIGYIKYKDLYSIREYCEKLKSRELTDPTVTPQLRAGFQWIKPIFNYVKDPTAGNCSILMAWPLEGISIEELIPHTGLLPGNI